MRGLLKGLSMLSIIKGTDSQTLYSILPDGTADLQQLGQPLDYTQVNISKVLASENTFPISVIPPDGSPYTIPLNTYSITNVSTNTIIYNGGLDTIIVDGLGDIMPWCDNPIDPLSVEVGSSLCGQVGPTMNIGCSLFIPLQEGKLEDTQKFRILAKNYTNSFSGFGADETISVQPGVPFDFTYESMENSTMEFIVAPSTANMTAQTAFLSCATLPANDKSMQLGHA